MHWKAIHDVVAWRLCLGCGACVPACPQGALTLVDVEQDGLRPKVNAGACAQCGQCLRVCPGIGIDKYAEWRMADGGWRIESSGANPKSAIRNPQSPVHELTTAWGTVLEIWEGYAADPEIRFHGSSGGVATALALFCLEKQPWRGVLHIAPNPADPLSNVPVVSTSRADLLARTGSRYAPAAPCLGLSELMKENHPSSIIHHPSMVLVGKPCDIVAVRKWQSTLRKDENHPSSIIHSPSFGLLISIFCAGTPSTEGTRKILERLSVRPDQVLDLRYRGRGWPGRTTVRLRQQSSIINNQSQAQPSLSYEEAWGTILSKHTQFRCRLCPDATGELADLSCGDPWYRRVTIDEGSSPQSSMIHHPSEGDPGRSLVLVRTETGRRILHEAMDAGYVHLEPAAPDTLPRSQRSLLQRRRQLWGRLLALRACGVPVPRYRGFSLWRNWCSLSFAEKLRSLLGTVWRIHKRKWRTPQIPVD